MSEIYLEFTCVICGGEIVTERPPLFHEVVVCPECKARLKKLLYPEVPDEK